MMHKKEYEKLASLFADSSKQVDEDFLEKMCKMLKEDNRKFNKEKFIDFIMDLRMQDCERRVY